MLRESKPIVGAMVSRLGVASAGKLGEREHALAVPLRVPRGTLAACERECGLGERNARNRAVLGS